MAHPDLDEILNALLPFAQQMLKKHGDFLPFGARMTTDGVVELLAGYTGADQSSSLEVIGIMAESLAAQASTGRIRAGGICYDVKLAADAGAPPVDAVCVSLDHSAAEPIDVYLPYELQKLGDVHYGELRASPGSMRFFPAAPTDAA